jgi:hypothetical protein
MAYIVEIIISSPVENYPDVLTFETAVRDTTDPDVDNIINTSLANGDLELYNRIHSEDATEYHLIATFNWKDEATYTIHTNDPTIDDDHAALEASFDVVRNLP